MIEKCPKDKEKRIDGNKNLPKQKVNQEAIKNASEGSKTQKYNDGFQF